MNPINVPAKYTNHLFQFKVGTLVGLVNDSSTVPTEDDITSALIAQEMYAIGYVKGYSLNPCGEVLVNVEWAGTHANYTRTYHPSKLVVIK